MPWLVALALLLWIPAGASAQAHCYEYGAPEIELEGTLLQRVAPGPPNYQDINSGDRPDTIWVLRLRQPICLRADSLGEKHSGITQVQLEVPEEDRRTMRLNMDRRTVFRGTLRPSVAGRRQFPVVFWSRLFMVDVRDPE